MNKKKNTFVIISTVLAILVLIFSLSKSINFFRLFDMYSPMDDSSLYNSAFKVENILSSFVLVIIPILLLIKYIFVTKNTDKYFDLSKLNKTLLFTNLVVIVIAIIDIIYNIMFIGKLTPTIKYFSVFICTYFVIFEIIYIILMIWVFLLKKKRIKK